MSNRSAPQPIVNIAKILPTTSQQNWFLDIVATHHVTPEIANLQITAPYNDNESLRVCNKVGLDIINVSSSTLKNPVNKSFTFSNILHVLAIT